MTIEIFGIYATTYPGDIEKRWNLCEIERERTSVRFSALLRDVCVIVEVAQHQNAQNSVLETFLYIQCVRDAFIVSLMLYA